MCLGRLGVAGADDIAPNLPEFIYAWCAQMMYAPDNEEKESAFFGMFEIILKNPAQGFGPLNTQQGRKNLAVFLDCMANYEVTNEKLHNLFYDFLLGYKQIAAPHWEEVFAATSPQTQDVLRPVIS